jgi:aminoglycoside phosphotransferase family enzyme
MMADELWPAGAEVVINRYVRPVSYKFVDYVAPDKARSASAEVVINRYVRPVSYKLVDYVAPDKARSASYERPLHSALPASIQ